MTDYTPRWAFEVAAERCNETALINYTVNQWTSIPFRELARMIAKHEQEPVDPLLIEARKIVSVDIFGSEAGHAYVFGHDESMWVNYTLRGLRRGMELAREQAS